MENSKKKYTYSKYNVFHDSFYLTYQKDAENITQLYDFFHLAARDILITHINKYFSNKSDIKILDVGPGAGKELEMLLPALEQIEKKIIIDLVDFNENVIEDIKKEILVNNKRFGKIKNNIAFNFYGGKDKGDINNFDFKTKSYDIIFSSFTIHHLTDRQKLNFYRNTYNVISDKGLLLILDLMKFHSEFISTFAANQEYGFILNNLLAYDIAKINETEIDKNKIISIIYNVLDLKYLELIHFEKLFEKVSQIQINSHQKKSLTYADFYKNVVEWINHYENENMLAPVEWQVELLSSLGYFEVTTPFIHWQNVLLLARK